MTLETLATSAREFVDKVRFGERKATYEFPQGALKGNIIHVSGPTEGRYLSNYADLFPLVGNFLHPQGYVQTISVEDRAEVVKRIQRVGDAYLKVDFALPGNQGNSIPLNSTLFLLKFNRDKLTEVIGNVRSLDDVTVSGVVQQPVDFRSKAQRFPKNAGVDEAVQYLKDLVFWNINFFDYSDFVNVTITERAKPKKGREQRTFLVERSWSKANASGPGGLYRPVDQGTERVVISGFKKK